jgi:hypothetical protein
MHQQPRAIDAPGRVNNSTRASRRAGVSGDASIFIGHLRGKYGKLYAPMTNQNKPGLRLAALERIKNNFDARSTERKLELLARLARVPLASAQQVERLHEVLCYLRAYPDDARVLDRVERLLADFARRADLRAFRDELAYTGIAGTPTWFPFFYPTARWIANRWPRLLRFDRSDTEAGDNLAKALPLLVTPVEAVALHELKLGGYAAIDRLRGAVNDATWLIERVNAMAGDDFTREAFYDAINPSCELLPGAATPSRTHAEHAAARIVFQAGAQRRERPDLRAQMTRAPASLRRVTAQEGAALIELARGALATRQRDLDAFAYGNPRDVWWVDEGDGLAFALIGLLPARRAPVAAIYGSLTLHNGVPIGYGQADLVGRACALSFNTFETFRGAAASYQFARYLAALHRLFGATSFSADPYQLGKGNDEGLQSGAWWFYFKLGFRPRAVQAQALARRESARRRRDPRHRSSLATLRRLAEHHMFFEFDPTRTTPLPDLAGVGLRIAQRLAQLAGADRERALELAGQAAQHRCGLSSLAGFTPAERSAWRSFGPLVLAIPRWSNWSRAERRALVELIRAKAGSGERGYALRLAAHGKLLPLVKP